MIKKIFLVFAIFEIFFSLNMAEAAYFPRGKISVVKAFLRLRMGTDVGKSLGYYGMSTQRFMAILDSAVIPPGPIGQHSMHFFGGVDSAELAEALVHATEQAQTVARRDAFLEAVGRFKSTNFTKYSYDLGSTVDRVFESLNGVLDTGLREVARNRYARMYDRAAKAIEQELDIPQAAIVSAYHRAAHRKGIVVSLNNNLYNYVEYMRPEAGGGIRIKFPEILSMPEFGSRIPFRVVNGIFVRGDAEAVQLYDALGFGL